MIEKVATVKKLVISRRRWIRGEGAGAVTSDHSSKLFRNSDKKMCCLGFYGRACGLSIDDIRQKSVPHEVVAPPEQMEWLLGDVGGSSTEQMEWLLGDVGGSSADGYELMDINDRQGDSNMREREIARIFKNHGITVEFTP